MFLWFPCGASVAFKSVEHNYREVSSQAPNTSSPNCLHESTPHASKYLWHIFWLRTKVQKRGMWNFHWSSHRHSNESLNTESRFIYIFIVRKCRIFCPFSLNRHSLWPVETYSKTKLWNKQSPGFRIFSISVRPFECAN